jgi:transcription elongation factor Elf1
MASGKWRKNNKDRANANRRELSERWEASKRCKRCGVSLDEDADAGMLICINCRQRVAISKIGGVK